MAWVDAIPRGWKFTKTTEMNSDGTQAVKFLLLCHDDLRNCAIFRLLLPQYLTAINLKQFLNWTPI